MTAEGWSAKREGEAEGVEEAPLARISKVAAAITAVAHWHCKGRSTTQIHKFACRWNSAAVAGGSSLEEREFTNRSQECPVRIWGDARECDYSFVLMRC